MYIDIIFIKWYNNHYINQQNPNDGKTQIRMISFAHFVDTSRCQPGDARDISTTVSLSPSGNLLKVTSFLTTCAGWALTCVSWPLVPLPSPETTHCIPPRRSANKSGTAWVLHSTGKGRLRRRIAKGSMLSFALRNIPVSRNFHHQKRWTHRHQCRKAQSQYCLQHKQASDILVWMNTELHFSRKPKALGLTSASLLFLILFSSKNNTTVTWQD